MTKTDIRGVIFGRTIRSHYAIVHLASTPQINNVVVNDKDKDNDDDVTQQYQHIVVRIQFHDNDTTNDEAENNHDNKKTTNILRSWVRRTCKIGDDVSLQNGEWTKTSSEKKTDWFQERFVMNVSKSNYNKERISLHQMQKINMKQCQQLQKKFLGYYKQAENKQSIKKNENSNNRINKQEIANDSSTLIPSPVQQHGGSTMPKRIISDIVANFFLHIMMKKHLVSADGHDCFNEVLNDPSLWSRSDLSQITKDDKATARLRTVTIDALNSGTGVLDIAGGSGHLSMALSLLGVKATIIDPREKIGKLPGRDRKIYNRALKKRKGEQPSSNGNDTNECNGKNKNTKSSYNNNNISDIPAVPYASYRAWFGAAPFGVDKSFRHPDEESIQILTDGHELLQNCSAIVALHPDEATDCVVDMAVKHRIPFIVVPCCVFGRLFQRRKKGSASDDEIVSTYEELLDYLIDKDSENIKKTGLAFDGANTVLWATY